MALVLLQISCFAVTVEMTANLNVYYPEYTKIDLVCGQMPKVGQTDVEFCCEAAFTGELLNDFKHSNIADNHICDGVMKKGYHCRANTGGFVWGKGKWRFMLKADYPTTADEWNMGFCQMLIIHNGEIRPLVLKIGKSRTISFIWIWEKAGIMRWYRDNSGNVKEIFPESKTAPNYKYRTNWITFYK